MPGGTATSDGLIVEYTKVWNGSWVFNLDLEGDYGGGDVTVSVKKQGSAGFQDLNDGGVFTSDANETINYQNKQTIRLTLANSTNPTLNWNLI